MKYLEYFFEIVIPVSYVCCVLGMVHYYDPTLLPGIVTFIGDLF